MGRELGKVAWMRIEANAAPCAHICRYCCIGDRTPKFPFARWLSFVGRFIDWGKAHGPEGISLDGGFLPSYNFDITTFIEFDAWYQRTHGSKMKWIQLGGLPLMEEWQMRHWLTERQAVGAENVHASFVGHGAVHDRWNGRRGDFDFLMRTLRTARELGFTNSIALFLTKSSLPLMEELLEKLDALPPTCEERHVRPFYYQGHGAHRESEYITEEDRERLPRCVTDLIGEYWNLRSEREWIEVIRSEKPVPTDIGLHLVLTPQNIDRLEATACGDIFADLEARARATLSTLPSLHELADIYGDRNGTKIFMSESEVDRLWLHRFLDEHPIAFDRSLLHHHLGRSLKPPPLSHVP
ncbi:hypothetical protein YS110_19185 [Acidovorax sp. YS12]|nr:hypothetical protein YS110_19185 [Acidovorax sp. YS12]